MAMQASVHPLSLAPDRRVLVVSDIHGNLPFLQGLLKKVGYSSDDILIVLGDILEKSTGGLDTLHYLMDLSRRNTVYFLQGNCEDVTLSFRRHAWPDEAAAQYGVDISRLRPRAVDRQLLESYDVALCMTEEQGDSLAERWPEFDERIICLGESDIRAPKFETQGAWNRLAERIAEEVRFLMDELMGDTGDDDDT